MNLPADQDQNAREAIVSDPGGGTPTPEHEPGNAVAATISNRASQHLTVESGGENPRQVSGFANRPDSTMTHRPAREADLSYPAGPEGQGLPVHARRAFAADLGRTS
jgi:hypothetical protein